MTYELFLTAFDRAETAGEANSWLHESNETDHANTNSRQQKHHSIEEVEFHDNAHSS